MKSQSMEDYIKAIYLIQEEQGGAPASTTGLAQRLGITTASVTGMLKRLASADPTWVRYEPYSGVELTPAGRKTALEMIRHHRLIETFLYTILGYTWDEVHAEAERLEHVISEQMEERMAMVLGHPTLDPHGDPIPDREGNLQAACGLPLSQLALGQRGVICRIIAQDPPHLRYLASLGLVPSAAVQVVEIAPFNGPLSLQLSVNGRAGATLALDCDLANKILVLPESTDGVINYERQHSSG
jgi:DtxR family transcriptional regulator, Mn-dependent transcriptional regulator